ASAGIISIAGITVEVMPFGDLKKHVILHVFLSSKKQSPKAINVEFLRMGRKVGFICSIP
ncbi:MAG TPA: hypothetical protein VIM65_03985, partial [Cyclobacteriaceae bacterium]